MIGVRHFGIVVSDLDRSLAFYRDLLKLSVVRRMVESGPFLSAILGMENAEVETVKLAGEDKAQIELLCFHRPEPAQSPPALNRCGPTHMALTITGLDDLYEHMRAKGVAFTTPPRLSPDGGAKVTFCRDPDGTFLELVELQMRSAE